MAILRLELGDGPLRTHHQHLLNTALKRGTEAPERRPDDVLEGTYSPDALRLARGNWRRRILHEHQSSAVFSGLLPFLVEGEAGLEFKTAVLRYAMDELRHSGLCAQVVELLDGDPLIEADLSIQALPSHSDCTRVEAALRNVLFTSLSETISVALLTEERGRAKEPFIQRVLDQLAGDEISHARFGWLYLREVWSTLDSSAQERTQRYLPVALGHLEAYMLQAMPLHPIAAPLLAEAQQLGFSDSETARSLLYDTIDAVILPGLASVGLEAHSAWENRRGPAVDRAEPVPAPAQTTPKSDSDAPGAD